MTDAWTALQFNASINAGDADGLAARMTDDHAFVDTAGSVVRGREACREAWRGFFEAFPTYRNEFDRVHVTADGLVVAVGRSVCADHAALDGPAIWTARVAGDLVAEWRVHEDTSEVRRRLDVVDQSPRPRGATGRRILPPDPGTGLA
ncbi:MAG: nuclear transport factor 2 family protein [Actinomycetota bacterium]|nr:nuclear transport factor 2 family protein [Actinomycetota bacterium]